MKGVLFNAVEEAVTREWGEEMWDDLLVSSGLEGAYTVLGNYPDAELVALADSAADRLNTSVDDVLRTLGRLTFKPLMTRYTSSVEVPTSLREFLPNVNDVIHPQVLKLYPGASVPRFALRENGDDLELDYLSVRRMCTLAEGLVLGAADHYGENVVVDQPCCKHRGDSRCTIRIRGAS
ncbi:heme NO-binding domain-containing protein [Mycobacterium sp. Y57]|uniref:heme NO-binding domain-containing protein n=1 Tax=Mycolicibacterium xanthum TaxID=2796469 RepID=UPI001C85C667|nr:heme NO-binding domain-containing protein [Mycolicibacterium xanthum]MBX7433099.1 heme NO-binding domain-containing protein [Mycolicibacterium xanthum]